MINRKFFSVLIIFIILFLISCTTKKTSQTDNVEQIQNEASAESTNTKLNIDFNTFNGFDMIQDNVKFIINGKTLTLKLPIYLDKNRHYICLNEFIEQLNGKISKINNLLRIEIDNKFYLIDLSQNTVKFLNNEFTLKKKLLNDENIYYISFFDFSHIFNLYTRWDKNNKIINCKINGFDNTKPAPYKSKINQIGLIRFEDVGLSSQSYSKDYFEKLRIMANYMYQKNIPYHIAWIPRYVIPNQGIDNDPLTKNNFEIAEMVYSLDYFTAHNGIIGLHGYTHQLGDVESGIGFEFGKYDPSVKNFEEKIQKAINTASYLDIPIGFFEAPHYEITPTQNKIAEKYFKILYYPFNDFGRNKADLTKPQLSPYNKTSYYISTPLDYIPIGKEELTLNKIDKNNNKAIMGSVFFHPLLENDCITLAEDKNSAPTFTYIENSNFKKLITILEKKGYRFIKVTDL
ncbi:hypothetical protein B0P06_002607 [Clostridium saccharoperbutylacetonicum]|uniref:DUF2334 domain-containing protein n=1 Tax=Clostridium saccharoperbutylacetonicum N1-4(HMT) TaxID=931276 RepID=M1MSD1_9CLOT|nr:DUF2334 domain-containing protein [Clostridium saccharoperbutylacetonicum]AGF59058.1 hypothetical protein DUF2334 [Clostridium saccharoperbutylacetonicum N1-4(HMT)]NRT60154.1 hypothetical protein [Clostridium saccharoperbutylacetonicum]NSB23466.1 hypothetical protein [Clostridium saccharoperbutylacetonicum]NSB42836.1 hypothetical protein [Clostridium saccharoperbutylacetonicum]